MNYLFVDIGTYRFKFPQGKGKDRAQKNSSQQHQIRHHKRSPDHISHNTLEELQIAIIKDYLHSGFEGKITYQLPSEYTTSRFIRLPVNNKKKRDDDSLPTRRPIALPISDAHYTASLKSIPTIIKPWYVSPKRKTFPRSTTEWSGRKYSPIF